MDERRWRASCLIWGITGCAAAVLGAVIGIVRATHQVPTDCSGVSDNPPCYSYPHAGEGLAIVCVSVALFAIVILAMLITTALEGLRPPK